MGGKVCGPSNFAFAVYFRREWLCCRRSVDFGVVHEEGNHTHFETRILHVSVSPIFGLINVLRA
jgi:hypothetical protein